MKARVSLTTLKRVAALERGRTAARIVGVWPRILGYDEWEALAMPHQERLCSATRGNEIVVTVDDLPDPMDVSHRYKPGPHVVFGTRVHPLVP